MADYAKNLSAPATVAVATGTNATVAVTVAAPPAGQAIYITSWMISASAAPATLVRATITGTGVTQGINIPAAAFAPITRSYGTHPQKCTGNTAAVLSVPALGSGVVCDVVLEYFLGPA